MTSARDDILGKLRNALSAGTPFPAAETQHGTLPVTHLADGENLATRFVSEVERVKGVVHRAASAHDALATLNSLLRERSVQRATLWDERYLPFTGVLALLSELGVARLQGDNALVETAQVGITGCDWAIAATGTLVLSSGPGRSRMASLLPPTHIALVHESRLIPRLEDWVAGRYGDKLQELRTSSNITLITGCSRTADIEMSPVFGVHGPLEFHVILLRD
jgi:L-lactate dehydrogenase complex protein LldG